MKAIELESVFGNNYILCLTETQQKMKKNYLSKYVTSMRDVKKMVGL